MIKLEVRVYVENANGPFVFDLEHSETGLGGYTYSSDFIYDKFKRGVFIPSNDGTTFFYPHHMIRCIEYNEVK